MQDPLPPSVLHRCQKWDRMARPWGQWRRVTYGGREQKNRLKRGKVLPEEGGDVTTLKVTMSWLLAIELNTLADWSML